MAKRKKLNFKDNNTRAKIEEIFNDIRDVNLNLKFDKNHYDIEMLNKEDAIKTSIINSLNINEGSNILFPERSSKIHDMLFNVNSDLKTKQMSLYAFLIDSEPRIDIESMNLNIKENQFNELEANIVLNYRMKNDYELREMNFSIKS